MTAKAPGSFITLRVYMCHRWVTVKHKPILVMRASYALLPSQQLLWVRLNWWPRRARLRELSDVSVCVWKRVFNPCPDSHWTPRAIRISQQVCVCLHMCVSSRTACPDIPLLLLCGSGFYVRNTIEQLFLDSMVWKCHV